MVKRCLNCGERNFPVKKLYARQRGDGRPQYAGWVCLKCFNKEMARIREEKGDPNFFSDDIRDLDIVVSG